MVDEYVWGHAGRVSPEAPVLVLDAARETFVPGGAANAANQLIALGRTGFCCWGHRRRWRRGAAFAARCSTAGADVSGMVRTPDRPTTQKTRIVAGAQQLVRIDREKRSPLPTATAQKLTREQTTEILAQSATRCFFPTT